MPPKRKGGAVKVPNFGDVKNVAREVHNLVKENQLLSTALNNTGFATAGALANAVGYGRRRRAPRRGRGFLDFAKGLVSAPLYAVSGLSAGLQQGVNGLGRRRVRRGSGYPRAHGLIVV